MNEIISVNCENDRPTVLGRELHQFLEVETRYNDWFNRMKEYGFNEGIDFYSILSKTPEGGRPSTDHQLTIEMAKEIAMLQRTEKGKQARQYFIQLEKAWNTPEAVMARAIKMADKKIADLSSNINQLTAKIEQDKPKVLFASAVEVSKTSILIGDLAKLLKQNGHEIGQKRLFEWLRNNNYLIKCGNSKNMPTQRAMDQELFEVKESTVNNPDGSVRITKTTKVTGKGQVYFINKILSKLK